MPKDKFYITTTLPYVNADPHIGFALEIIQADTIARWKRLQGYEVLFNTGTDEHGLKIYRKALENGLEPKVYCDQYAARFSVLDELLNLTYTNFIRTTDEHHIKACQEIWRRCLANGDIYKKNYNIKYCVGCELEKTDSELEDDRCPIHPNLEIEIIAEENYFFRFSRYQEPLLFLYDEHSEFVVPVSRLNEIREFVKRGLEDFSISRLKSKMPWGVAVPDDEDHVMYVWFDALTNYISTLGWPDEKYREWWPGMQIAGKDNLRQQAAMWQAMLISAGLEPSTQIFIHGFITANGQKMSKSLGNVIDPYALVERYGTDAVRYYLLSEINPFDDGDYSQDKFEKRYNGNLANGIGNLTNRILTMIEKYCDNRVPKVTAIDRDLIDFLTKEIWPQYQKHMDCFRFDLALEAVWKFITHCDQLISDKQPWALAKEGKTREVEDLLYHLAEALRHISIMIWPALPETSEKIISQLGLTLEIELAKPLIELQQWVELTVGNTIKKQTALFPRLEVAKEINH